MGVRSDPAKVDKRSSALIRRFEWQARSKVAETGRKYAVYYSERLHVESSVYAEQLIKQGAIGRVHQVIGLGAHRIKCEE